jgi:hypothetical protein
MTVVQLQHADGAWRWRRPALGGVLIVASFLLLAGVIAHAASSGAEIGRSHITGPTRRDPFVARGTYMLRVRGHDLVARWRGTVRRTTRLDFLISPTTKSGGGLPGFNGEPPQRSLHKTVRKGHDRTVIVVFRHPRVVRGWPCVTGYIIDEPPGVSRVYPLGPFAVPRLCPHGGFVG